MTWVGSFPRWMRPFVVRFCDLNKSKPGCATMQLMFYQAALQYEDPHLQQFCKLFELKIKEIKEAQHENERKLNRISKALRRIESDIDIDEQASGGL